MDFVFPPIKIEYTEDISIKIEKDDVPVKLENEGQTKSNELCISNSESTGNLLEPLFFEKIENPKAEQCAICCRYFSDSKTILQHNITHLRVHIRNPKLFQCDKCSVYFTDRHKIYRHIQTHLRINGLRRKYGITYMLTYKPKSYVPKTGLPFNSRYGKSYVPKPKKIKVKLEDGVTNELKYKPKSCKSQMLLDFECQICKKVLPYSSWHSHMKEAHCEGGYSCNLCKLELKCERYFLKHVTL